MLGMPPAKAGERFVGVYCGARDNRQTNYGFDETYTLYVVISMRAPRVPFDKIGTDLIAKVSGALSMDALADSIRAVIGKDVFTGKVRTRANVILGDSSEVAGADPVGNDPRGFSVGLTYLGESDPEAKGGSWYGSQEDEDLAGVVIRQRYGGARRLQSWQSASVL